MCVRVSSGHALPGLEKLSTLHVRRHACDSLDEGITGKCPASMAPRCCMSARLVADSRPRSRGMGVPRRSRQRGAWSPWLLQGFFDRCGVVNRLDAGVVGAGTGVSGRFRHLCCTLCAVWKQWDILVPRYSCVYSKYTDTSNRPGLRAPCGLLPPPPPPWPIRPS